MTQKIKVYLGGKYGDRDEIQAKMEELRKCGCEITHDWTRVEQHDRSHTAYASYAEFDIDGIRNCDVAVFLMDDPEYAYRGTFTELGCALGLEKTIYLVCPSEVEAYCKTNVFFHHSLITHVDSWEELVEMF